MKSHKQKAILFLYEGETEGEFYKEIFRKYVPPSQRKVKSQSKCLNGVFSVNIKVANSIYNYLNSLKKEGDVTLEVFVALDRDGIKPNDPSIDIDEIKKRVNEKALLDIHLIVATQDIESWFFFDIENIYSFLRTPSRSRTYSKYINTESLSHKDLIALFKRNKKEYKKGKKVEGLLKALDLEKIYNRCDDLRTGINLFIRKISGL